MRSFYITAVLTLAISAVATIMYQETATSSCSHHSEKYGQACGHGPIHHNPSFCKINPSPYPTTLQQIDGQDISVRIKGSSVVHYLETLDGFTIIKDTDGAYKYAKKGNKDKLICSDVLARDAAYRSAEDQDFLASIEKNLRYNDAQVQEKTASYQALSNVPTNNNNGNNTAGTFPTTGTRKALLILVDYPDQGNTFSTNNFDNLTNQVGYSVNGQNGSFRDYYKDISYDALTINTDVEGWYTANSNKAAYGDDNNDYGGVNLVREAVDAAELAGVDFSQYDGDGDGAVDVVMVIHSGRGAEESGNGDDIWSHRWVLAANNSQVSYDGVLINDYIVQAETYGSSNIITNIGVLCHEFGHALGLPDLYDTDGSSEGIGRWCLMAGGTWNNAGKTPAQMSAWCKKELGWTSPTLLTGSGTITGMDHNDNASVMYRMNTPNPSEYFLIENRQQIGWDTHLPGEGLAIWHIDETIINGGGNTVNADETRYGVHLEQADAMLNLNNGDNRGDQGDLFPGSSNKTVFNNESSPNSKNYNADDTGVNISSIVESGTTMSFDYGATGTITYCGSSANDASYEWIDTVIIGNITNASGSDGGYAHFTSLGINLAQNTTENIRLVPGFATTSYTEFFKVWIDFNQNGMFTDPGELVFQSSAESTEPVDGMISIPATSTLGETRMRVSMKWIDTSDSDEPTSCLSFSYGEVEDYTINITAGSTPLAPVASFSANNTSGDVPLTVNFSDSSSNDPDTWQWSFPGGTPSSSTEQNPTVVYNTPGVYDVTLTVSNSAGNDSKTITDLITATPAVIEPVANFSANNTIGNAPLTVNFSDLSTNNPDTWQWSFPGGTPSSSTEQNPTVIYNTAGQFTVTLVVSNSAGNNTKTLTNYITTTPTVIEPVANFSADNTSGDAPLMVNFSDLSTNNPDTWQWSFPGGTPSSSTEQNPSVVYNTPGSYSVTLVASNTAGGDSKTITNYISANQAVLVPVANFAADNTSGDAPLTVNFSDLSTNEPISWQWSFPGGTPSSSTEQNPIVVYNTPGNYNVTLVATNTAGSNAKTLNNYILANQAIIAPVANFSADNTSGDAPLTVNFSDLSTNEPDTWQWTFPGGTPSSSTEQNPTVVYNTPGNYNVTLVATNAAGDNSKTLTDYITATQAVIAPIANFSSDVNSGEPPLTVQFSDNSSNNPDAWEWTFEGGTPSSSTDQNPTVVYYDQGSFAVSLKAINAAGNHIETKEAYISIILSSVEEHEIVDYIMVAPNPTPDIFNLKMELKSSQEVRLRIYDLMGKEVYTNTLLNAQRIDMPIDLKNQATGVYLVNIQIGDLNLTEKLLLLK